MEGGIVIAGARRLGRTTALHNLIAARVREGAAPFAFVLDNADHWAIANLPEEFLGSFAVTCLDPARLPAAFQRGRVVYLPWHCAACGASGEGPIQPCCAEHDVRRGRE